MWGLKLKVSVWLGYCTVLGLLTILTALAPAQQTPVLDNGLVRISFDRYSGQFDIETPGDGSIALRGAPRVEVDGKSMLLADSKKIDVKQEPFTDALGTGEKLVVDYSFDGTFPGFRYEVCVYQGKSWASGTVYLPKGNYKLGDVAAFEGRMRVPSAYNARVYVNSGEAGGNTGVWDLGMRRLDSAAVSVLYAPDVRKAVQFGFYSFHRADTSVAVQYWDSNNVAVNAIAHYNGYAPKTDELRSESLLLNFGTDPVKMLEDWTDAAVATVHPQFNHSTREGFINTWYAFGDKATEADQLQQAKLLRDSVLPGYGVKFVELGEWQKQRPELGDLGDSLGFGEDQVDARLFPHGVSWLCQQYHELGFGCSFGANYAYASYESSLVTKNVSWLVREDKGRAHFGIPIDFTDPAAQKWVYDLYHQAASFDAKWVWSDFDGGPIHGTLRDPTKIMGFEDIREGMKAIRSAVGTDTFIHKFCCGPYFSYLGLADRVRTGNDMVGLGDWNGLMGTARQLAGNFMLHQKFWISDPDPLYVGGRDYVHNYGTGPIPADAAIEDEVRMRLQLQMTSGGFVTIGENMEDLDANRIHLLTLVLPTYGQAARPLDMFKNSTPEVYDLPVKTDWDHWHVLILQNWNMHDGSYSINFSELNLDAKKSYLVYRFWDKAFLGEYREGVTLKVCARQGESYAIRERRPYPWVLSTDMNLTQGGVELKNVRYDEVTGRLSGTASRAPGAEGEVILYVPQGYKAGVATGVLRTQQVVSGGQIVSLQVKFQQADVQWSVSFEKAQLGAR